MISRTVSVKLPMVLIYVKSALVQVMAWCRQATSHYHSQCWTRSLSPNSVSKPQWIKARQMWLCSSYDSLTLLRQMIEIQSQSRAYLSVAVSYHNCCSEYLQPENNFENDVCFAVSLGLVGWCFFCHFRCAEFNATCPQAGRNLHALYDFQ